jgi:uncharacterized protein YndB with AHSA1/START domain
VLKKLGVAFGIIVIGILFVAAFKSAEMHVSRETVIAASPETLFAFVNNSKKSYEWMPWAAMDPQMQLQFSGPSEGVGAKSEWNGKEMGAGTSVVVASVPNETVSTRLDYTKPFEMSQIAEVSLSPVAGGTRVQWSASGHNNFFFRLISIFVDCDKMIGGEFEKGLAKLKTLAEGKN